MITPHPKKLFSGFLLLLTVTHITPLAPPLLASMEDISVYAHRIERTTECGFCASIDVDRNPSATLRQAASPEEICPHTTLDTQNQCTLCGQTMVAKLWNGVGCTYYTDWQEAWNAAAGNTITIELLQDVTVTDTLTVERATNVTLTSATGKTLTSRANPAVNVKGTFTLAGGTLQNKAGNCLEVGANGAAINVIGGALVSNDKCIRSASWESAIYISGGTLTGATCLSVGKGATVQQIGGITEKIKSWGKGRERLF